MKEKKTLIISIASILLLSVVAVTFAYFAANVNNTNPARVSVQAGNLELTLNNGSGDITQLLDLNGTPIEYTFSITNKGTYDEYAKVSWLDMINTYTDGTLVYKLYESETENVFGSTPVATGNVPVSASASKQTLADTLLIPANVSTKNNTIYYKLTVEIVNLDGTLQTIDANTKFYTKFTLDVGSSPAPTENYKFVYSSYYGIVHAGSHEYNENNGKVGYATAFTTLNEALRNVRDNYPIDNDDNGQPILRDFHSAGKHKINSENTVESYELIFYVDSDLQTKSNNALTPGTYRLIPEVSAHDDNVTTLNEVFGVNNCRTENPNGEEKYICTKSITDTPYSYTITAYALLGYDTNGVENNQEIVYIQEGNRFCQIDDNGFECNDLS